MWVLEAISDVSFKKPFLILSCTLGSAFLILAYFLHIHPMYEPSLYALLGIALYYGYEPFRFSWKPAVLAGILYALAYFLFPVYKLVFAASFMLAAGRFVFPHTFRGWKWVACSVLFLISLLTGLIWQQISLLMLVVPPFLIPAIHGVLFGFCALTSFVLFAVRKDSVLEAFDHYAWNKGYEASSLADQTRSLYQQIQKLQEDRRAKETLEEYTEKIIHFCFRLQEISDELSRANVLLLQQQIAHLKEKCVSVTDPATRIQYEQALSNKEKQADQLESLKTQAERMRAQILNYISALENMQFAYSTQHFHHAGSAAESIEYFLDIAKAHAESAFV